MEVMLAKIKAFNYIFQKSIISFAYYREIVKSRFKFSLKYFIVFSLFIGVMLSVTFNMAFIPVVNNFLSKINSRIYLLYPEDLVITLKNGEISTNVPEPIRFPIPFNLVTDTPPAVSDQKQLYLLTIDTKANISDFGESQSLIFITKNDYAVKSDKGGYHIDSLKNIKDLTLDKNSFNSFLDKILPIVKILPIILIIGISLFFIFLLPLSRLLSLAVLSLILLIPASLMKLNLSYKKIYQIGLHSMTIPTIIQIAMLSFGLIVPLPFFNSILFLLYTLAIFSDLTKYPELKKTAVK